MTITILGSKGSIPYFNRESLTFGGNTSCVAVDIYGDGSHVVLLDCGSGAYGYSRCLTAGNMPKRLDILLSHLHVDHIIGLSMFGQLYNADSGLDYRIFTKSRNGKPLAEQIFGLYKPPYWPFIASQRAYGECIAVDGGIFCLSDGVSVRVMDAKHANETTVFRINAAGKSLVYLLDSEIPIDENEYAKYIEFCKNADCLIFDGCFLPNVYPSKTGLGHSTYEIGIKLAEDSGCKMFVNAHWSQEYGDAELLDAQQKMRHDSIICHAAYDGLEFII
jgi:ribonuclease BN (tRNA processing enzyme)